MRSILKETREKKGLTQAQFAALVGVRPATVSEWETQDKTMRPCYIDPIRAILESQDPHLFDTDVPTGVLGFKDIIDMLRRHFIEKLGAIGLAPLLANMSLAIVTTPTVEPDEYLAQCRIALDNCWEWGNQGDYPKIARTLKAYVSSLTRLANTISPFQAIAAKLVVELKILQIVLAKQNLDYMAVETYCVELPMYGAISDNSVVFAVALDWQAQTYDSFFHQPQRAIPLLNNALTALLNAEDNALLRSVVYSDLSHAYSQDNTKGDYEQKARKYSELAHVSFPVHPEINPFYQCIRVSSSELYQFDGRSYLNMARNVPNRDYAQMAYDTFEQSLSEQAMDPHYSCSLLIGKADALQLLGDKDECVKDLTNAYEKASSVQLLTKISDVLHHVPNEWKRETEITTLQNEVSRALVVAPK